MGNSAVKGYSDIFGKHAAWIGDHTGPSSYAKGGETLTANGAPGSLGGLRSVDVLLAEALSKSGNYLVQSQATASGGGNPGQTGKLVWLYSALNTSAQNAAAAPAGVPLALSATSTASSTVSAVTSGGVITITIANSLVPGNFVLLSAFTQLGALNGLIVQVQTASATQFTATFAGVQAAVTSGADTTGKYQLVEISANNLVQLGTVATITNSLSTTTLLTMTCANAFVPGQFVVIQGLTNGAKANGYIVQILSASATQFTATWRGTSFTTAADTGTATLLVTNGAAPVTAGPSSSITNSLATASSAGTAGVISLSAVQSYVPGNIGVVAGLTHGAILNGDILAVISTGLTNALFESNMINAGATTNADAGTFSLLVTGVPTSTAGQVGSEVTAGTNLSGESVRLLAVGG